MTLVTCPTMPLEALGKRGVAKFFHSVLKFQ